MTRSIPGSNENIYQLLSQNNFTFINQKIDDYKCTICQRILANAYQAFCGCNYCEKCVDEQVRSGVIFCPGDTEACKTATLSSVVINHGKNKQILRWIVKCPEEMCCYENIKDHLRLCGERSVECPFTDFGCDQGKLKRDELNEHLHQESYRRSEILIDVIGELRNELAELKRNREQYNATSDRENIVIIDSLREEIKSMKKAVLGQRVGNLGNTLDGKSDKTVLEQRVDNLGNTLDGKSDKTVLEQRVDNLGNTLDGKVNKMVAEIEGKSEEMRQWRGAIEQHQLALANVEERNEVKYQTEIAERIDSVEKCLAEKIDADFVWTIDKIVERRYKYGADSSEYFYGFAEPYKMRLHYFHDGDYLWFHFIIYCGESDEYLQWPFDRNITIAITNQMRPKANIAIRKRRTIENPFNISSQWSDPFLFNWNELSAERLLRGNHLIVQCFIHHG